MEKKYLQVIERKNDEMRLKSFKDFIVLDSYSYKGYTLELRYANFKFIFICERTLNGCNICDSFRGKYEKVTLDDDMCLTAFHDIFLSIEKMWRDWKSAFERRVESSIKNDIENESLYNKILEQFVNESAYNIFDDIVDDGYDKWSYVCDECKAKLEKDWKIVEGTACEDLICGVSGCRNDATYYVEIGSKK